MKSSISDSGAKILILLDIRSAHNVGALFRTADAIGVDSIYLVGTTPKPLDRFERPVKEIAKTALGAEKSIPYVYYPSIDDVFEALRKKGCSIVALEQDARAVDYKAYIPKECTALLLGNEVTGVPKEILAMVDDIVQIPMYGEKESLNVAVAGGVALYRLFDK